MPQASTTVSMTRSRFGRYLLPVALSGIALATLTPAAGGHTRGFAFCLVCGERGLVDDLLNALLFLPLGLALGGLLHGRRRALLLGAALSLAIELTQLRLPGRYPTLADLVFNTIGTGLGIHLCHTARLWLEPRPLRARRLAAGALGLALGILALSGYLLGPGLPHETYFGQWTPDLSHLETYRGQVLAAYIGDLPVPGSELSHTAELRAQLLAGEPLRVEAVAGPPVLGLAPIFRISTRWRREVLLLGAEGEDAVFRYHTRSALLFLERPELRVRDAFRQVRPGDPLHLAIRPAGHGYCMEVNELRRCGLGFTAGDLGSLLLYSRAAPPWQQRWLGLAALATLFAPAGFWIRRARGLRGVDLITIALRAGLITAGLTLIPPAVGLLATTPAEYLAALAGFSAGIVGGTRFQRVNAVVTSGGTGEVAPI